MSTTLAPRISVQAPSPESLEADYGGVKHALDTASDFQSLVGAVERWDALRRRLRTWRALVHLRFRQDTRDEQARADRARADELEPQILARDAEIKRRLLERPDADSLRQRYGSQAFRLWQADLESYDSAIDADLVEESRLQSEYTSLFGGISVEFGGRRLTLPEVRGYLNHADRELRHAAERARWSAIGAHGEQLDRLYADLVTVRDRIGRTLGEDGFVPVAYARMHRVD